MIGASDTPGEWSALNPGIAMVRILAGSGRPCYSAVVVRSRRETPRHFFDLPRRQVRVNRKPGPIHKAYRYRSVAICAYHERGNAGHFQSAHGLAFRTQLVDAKPLSKITAALR